jgi:predicted acyltransferase
VDMVFPGFLFILGMAIPLALQARIKKGDHIPAILGHIALRSVALIVLAMHLRFTHRFLLRFPEYNSFSKLPSPALFDRNIPI